ncbi:MAG: hypothetical protein HZB42_08085 [Sphingobacteriales bacterium]|nr:hypothetical protein [Sphingobacteriales bacterium]
MIPESHICRICGHDMGEPAWEDDNPNWLICNCCGSESGYEDTSVESVRANRSNWVKNGCKWFLLDAKPAEWDLQAQLNRISQKWK